MIRWRLYFVASCLALCCCSAQDLVCTVTQNGNQTNYNVPGYLASADCLFDWANATGHNIVTEVQKGGESVLNANISSFTTYGCLSRVLHSRSCLLEGRRTAVCDVNCTSGTAGEAEAIQRETEPDRTLLIGPYHWLLIGCSIALFIAVIILLVVRYKGVICRVYGSVRDWGKGCMVPPLQMPQDQADPARAVYIEVPGEENDL
ncbi:uncharacterized protein LOC144542360 [Centroberyx gerrardi]